jgi:hypothetical protein
MTRRLEDRIRELCSQAVSASDPEKLHESLKHLRSALREHIQLLRKRAVQHPPPPQRRQS